jgi:hypothetical protein
MVAITVTIPTVIGNIYRSEVTISRVTVRTSRSQAPLIRSSNVTLPSRGKRLRVAIAWPQNLYQHAEHNLRVMNAVNEGQYYRATRPTAPVDPQTEMSEEEGSEMVGPSRVSPSDRQPYCLIHPDLSCGAEPFPEDLTPRRLSSPCYWGPRVRILLPPAESLLRT